MSHYPTHEVWGGFTENGECDDPHHLEDCFSRADAEAAAAEWAQGQGRYAFVRTKDDKTALTTLNNGENDGYPD